MVGQISDDGEVDNGGGGGISRVYADCSDLRYVNQIHIECGDLVLLGVAAVPLVLVLVWY